MSQGESSISLVMLSLQFMSNAVKWTAVGAESIEKEVQRSKATSANFGQQRERQLLTKCPVCLNKKLPQALLCPVLGCGAIFVRQPELPQGSATPSLWI